MRKTHRLCLCLLVLSACEIEEGPFDGGFWDDARVDDEDSGGDEDDAGRTPRDAGSDAGRDAALDSGMDAAADSGTGSDLKPSDVAAVIARGLCGAAERCIGKTLLQASLQGNDCVDFSTKQQADRHLHWLQTSVDAGRVTFRPEKLVDCEKDLIALGCEVRSRRLPASCEEAVEGKADVTSNCTIDQDCKNDAWCDKGELETCPGVCVQTQTQGLPCRSTSHCQDGLVCRNGSCAAPLSEGDMCDPTAGRDCPYGLVCQGGATKMCWSTESLYAAKKDEDCDAVGRLCEVGLVCQSQMGTGTMGKCVEPAPLNGTCRRAVPAQCRATQYCKDARTNSVDRAMPGVDGVCSDRPADGETCIANEECMPGTACVGDDMEICRTLKRAGGSCVSNAQCYGGLCEEEICAITTIGCP